mmetsp:Transcript_68975/g.121996  ORF Transcript_68975/g.121996 Transcript_68975/m.121996 type:complete len:215 (-) Transcript_68975:114-758(-)
MLAFNAGMAASLKTVLSNHDRALDNYQRTQALQDARVSELQAWQALQSQENNAQSHPQQQVQWPNSLYGSMMSRLDWIMDEPKKGARLEEKVRDAKEHLAESKQAGRLVCLPALLCGVCPHASNSRAVRAFRCGTTSRARSTPRRTPSSARRGSTLRERFATMCSGRLNSRRRSNNIGASCSLCSSLSLTSSRGARRLRLETCLKSSTSIMVPL